jgi:phosphoglycolate phosphatase
VEDALTITSLKVVVFDLDGTLVTNEIDFMGMRESIRDYLISKGFPPDVLPMTSTQDLLRSAFYYAGNKGLTLIEISQLRDQVYAIASKIEWEGAQKAKLVEGARETLLELQKRHVGVGVLTNDNRQVADFLLKKYSLIKLVGKLVTRDDAPHMKPATDGLEMILEHFNATPAQTIFVGDTTIDIMTAKKLGIKCIARLSKVRTEDELRREGAIEVFPTLTDIIPYLETHSKLPSPK